VDRHLLFGRDVKEHGQAEEVRGVCRQKIRVGVLRARTGRGGKSNACEDQVLDEPASGPYRGTLLIRNSPPRSTMEYDHA